MHLEYISIPSSLYGGGGGRSHAHPRARKCPGRQSKEDPLVGLPNSTFLRTHDVVESSQLAIEERSALAEETLMTMHGTMMVV